MRCVKCGRKLKHEPPPEALGFGPSCFRSAFGSRAKPRKVKAEPKRDSLTPDLFDGPNNDARYALVCE